MTTFNELANKAGIKGERNMLLLIEAVMWAMIKGEDTMIVTLDGNWHVKPLDGGGCEIVPAADRDSDY